MNSSDNIGWSKNASKKRHLLKENIYPLIILFILLCVQSLAFYFSTIYFININKNQANEEISKIKSSIKEIAKAVQDAAASSSSLGLEFDFETNSKDQIKELEKIGNFLKSFKEIQRKEFQAFSNKLESQEKTIREKNEKIEFFENNNKELSQQIQNSLLELENMKSELTQQKVNQQAESIESNNNEDASFSKLVRHSTLLSTLNVNNDPNFRIEFVSVATSGGPQFCAVARSALLNDIPLTILAWGKQYKLPEWERSGINFKHRGKLHYTLDYLKNAGLGSNDLIFFFDSLDTIFTTSAFDIAERFLRLCPPELYGGSDSCRMLFSSESNCNSHSFHFYFHLHHIYLYIFQLIIFFSTPFSFLLLSFSQNNNK